MLLRTSVAALLTVSIATSANADEGRGRGPSNRSLDSINQPVVQRTDYVLDLASDGSGLADGERGRLDEWFRSLGVGYGDRVYVEGDYGRSADDVARVAADYGLLLSDGAPITTGPIRNGGVRVVISRSEAYVPNCPNYEGRSGASMTSSNYGCGVNSNFAAMVADPGDLVLGQAGSGTGDSTTASKAIKVYRETPPTGIRGLMDDRTRGSR